MVKKTYCRVVATDTNGDSWGIEKEISKTSKMAIADIFEEFKNYIKLNCHGAKLCSINFYFDDGI